MGRTVQFTENECVVKLTGAPAFFALKSKVKMSYDQIKSVYVDVFEPPFWMLRMPGTAIAPLYIYEGSYLYRNEWYFLSFERKQPFFMVELDGSGKYKYVVVQIKNPKEAAAELRRRLRENEEKKSV
ncbi:hypothetical protein [Metabacillus sp. RGM 3146]|uniref:hypothetical protein n=1 Tax=Metabacillus sp. RGM 3146 TaxID=3401092 RepID=UPI003B9A4A5A